MKPTLLQRLRDLWFRAYYSPAFRPWRDAKASAAKLHGFLTSRWLERPPTNGQIIAHGEDHGVWRLWAVWQWMAPLDQTVEIGTVYLDGNNLQRAGQIIQEIERDHAAVWWRPVSMTGDPVALRDYPRDR